VYPGDYWLSLREPPARTSFLEPGPQGNSIAPTGRRRATGSTRSSRLQLLSSLGNQLTRSVDHVLQGQARVGRPMLKPGSGGWARGLRGDSMYGVLLNQGNRSLRVFADWSERNRRKGEVLRRRRGRRVERNVVVTLWTGASTTRSCTMRSDRQEQTDRQRPRPGVCGVRGHGMRRCRPETNRTEEIEIPTRAPRAESRSLFPNRIVPRSGGATRISGETLPYNPADPHNGMLDSKGASG